MKPRSAEACRGAGELSAGGPWRGVGTAPPGGNRRGESAYTMAEVLVGVLILGAMVVSLYGGFSAGFAVLRLSRDEERATQILMRRVESLRLSAWSQLANLSLQERYDPLAAPANAGGTVYGVTVSTNVPDSIPDEAPYKNDMRLVTVTVWWTNYNGDSPVIHSRQLQTHVARYGLQNYCWGMAP